MASSGKMVHTTARGRDFLTRVRGNGIEGAAAENIAAASAHAAGGGLSIDYRHGEIGVRGQGDALP